MGTTSNPRIMSAFHAGWYAGRAGYETTPMLAWNHPLVTTDAENNSYCEGAVDGAAGDTFRLVQP
jgi:hypothetical protein